MTRYWELKHEDGTDDAELYIFGDIAPDDWKWSENDRSAMDIVKAIEGLSAKNLIVHINSYGGDVKEGLAIYNCIKNCGMNVTTINDGFACSAASVIFMAGKQRVMNDASLLMIHNPYMMAVGNPDELRKAAEHTGWKSVVVKSTGALYSVTRTDDQTILDLGSVGKGYALDVVYDALKPEIGKTLDGGVIAVGGSILVFGKREDGSGASEGKGFRVGIRDPEGQSEDVLGVITFPENTEKCCISTSGGYEKYVEKDGVRYHHIIDPATLHPADSGLASVTVVCENGLVSDGLSTACFILGEEKAKQLLSEYGAEGILIREDGSRYITPGLEGRVEWK